MRAPPLPRPLARFQLVILVGGEVVGDVGLNAVDEEHQAEIDVTLAPRHQGKGLATESLRALLDARATAQTSNNTVNLHLSGSENDV